MKSTLFLIGLLLFSTLFFTACTKQIEDKPYDFETERLTELFPMQAGKYIIYRLDSTVFVNFGRKEETHSYQQKDVVDAQVQDNLGRTTYRVFRYIRDTTGVKPWMPSSTYFVTPLANQVEVSENNLRQVKVHLPVKKDFSWKGNRHLPAEPYGGPNGQNGLYGFNNDNDMNNWDFAYQQVNEPLILMGKLIQNTATVLEVDESTTNVPITDLKSYASKSLSLNTYAKGIGLVFQEYVLWEYDVTTQATPFRTGFGVKRTMIDHN